MSEPLKFWQKKSLKDFTPAEWESICTNCGRCCQIKLQDEESDEVYYTDVVCRYFNHTNCHCTEYTNRCTLVPECVKLTADNLDAISWMPQLCAYRILNETGDLPDWHPLNTNQPLADRYSMRNRVISEVMVKEEELEDHIIEEEDDERE